MEELINQISKDFRLGEMVEGIQKIDGGLTNKIYKLTTNKDNYIIKFLNPKNVRDRQMLDLIESSEEISSQVRKNGVKSLPAMKFNNKFIQNYKDIYFLIYKYYDGKVILSKEINIEKCRILGEELGKIHNTPIDKTNICKDDRLYYSNKIDFDLYANKIKKIDRTESKIFLENLNQIKSIYEDVYKKYMNISAQNTYTHKDLNRKNILWKDDLEFIIIDWENARYSNPSLDFFNSAWFLTDDIKEEKYAAFAKGYFSKFKFQDNIETSAYAALIDEIIWLEFSLKRALKIISQDNDEIELGFSEIPSTIKEIENYYIKIPLMIQICKKNNY